MTANDTTPTKGQESTDDWVREKSEMKKEAIQVNAELVADRIHEACQRTNEANELAGELWELKWELEALVELTDGDLT